jgi:P27 family predicted phage terminase small subunit
MEAPEIVKQDERALGEWVRVVPELVSRGLVENLDSSLLAAYCLSWSRFVAAVVWLAENGDVMTLRTDKGEVKSSAVAPKMLVAERSLDRAVRLAGLVGLTPPSRLELAAGLSGDDNEQLRDFLAGLSA